MRDEARRTRAIALFEEGHRRQRAGDLDGAVEHYRQSIEQHPTAEAHTLLGLTYSARGRFDEAMAECREAIALDPGYGKPYNEIGAALIAQGQLDDAVPWLERAIRAPRYSDRHQPHVNLARIYRARGELRRAIGELEHALAIAPRVVSVRRALNATRRLLN